MREIPNWHEYFMSLAVAVSSRSKDPSTQVGCVIVDKNKHVIATGYNGMPPSFEDTHVRWSKKFKYDYVCHAELNAMLHTTASLRGSSIYVTLYPCKDCAKYIASAGIKNIYYLDDKYYNEISKKIFLECNIKCKKLEI